MALSLFSLYVRTGLLALEAQQVMALRMLRLAGGGARARRELGLMMSEKMFAAAQAGATAALSLAAGANSGDVAAGAVRGYRRRVRRNRRRLTRS